MKHSKKSFRKFLLLWSGEFISAIGSGLTSFGLGVYVYQQTKNASAMALVTLLAFMPSVLLSAPAGVLADRYDRRILMVLGDSLSVLGLLYILNCMLSQEAAQLWQICIGVTISSTFSSLLEPAYRATVTDLLTEEQYTKASGLVQVAGSAKYLISPVIAGFLLTVSDVRLLLILDCATFFITVFSTLVVRNGLTSKKCEQKLSFYREFKDGWSAISSNRGVLVVVMLASVITFFLGFIQTLSTPMILAFSDSSKLGTVETIAASGMLVTSMILGLSTIKMRYTKMLSLSLFMAGIFMALFGIRENLILISSSGFLFFAMLPFANTSLDYLIRTNIDNSVQGRAWGFIGIISQLGYVASYALSGVIADYLFTPWLMNKGVLSRSVGRIIGTGAGRGTGFSICIAGLLLSVVSIISYRLKSLRMLEKEVDYVLSNHTQ